MDFLWEMITKWKVLNLVSDMPVVVVLFCTHYFFVSEVLTKIEYSFW